MTAPRMTQEDVGAVYTAADGSIWRLVTYAAQPTARFERLFPNHEDDERSDRLSGAVGSPVFDGFTRLAHVEQVARCAYPGCPSEDVELVGQTFPRTHPTLDHVAIGENVFVCPRHDGWLREDACEHVVLRVSG